MGVYNADRAGIGRMLQSRAIFEAPLKAFADKIVEEARVIAPRSSGTSGGMHYQDSFRSAVIEDEVLSRFGPHRGLVGHAYSVDPNALSIETGTSTTPAHNVLTKAMGVLNR